MSKSFKDKETRKNWQQRRQQRRNEEERQDRTEEETRMASTNPLRDQGRWSRK